MSGSHAVQIPIFLLSRLLFRLWLPIVSGPSPVQCIRITMSAGVHTRMSCHIHVPWHSFPISSSDQGLMVEMRLLVINLPSGYETLHQNANDNDDGPHEDNDTAPTRRRCWIGMDCYYLEGDRRMNELNISLC